MWAPQIFFLLPFSFLSLSSRGRSGRGRRPAGLVRSARGPSSGGPASADFTLLAVFEAGGGGAGCRAAMRRGGGNTAILSSACRHLFSARLPRPPLPLQSGDLPFLLLTTTFPSSSPPATLDGTLGSGGGAAPPHLPSPAAAAPWLLAPPFTSTGVVAHPLHLLLHRRQRSSVHMRRRTGARGTGVEMKKTKGAK
jgi:hypothetical protein